LSDGGIRLAVTGTGLTLAAIQRMLTEHGHEMDGKNGWAMPAEPRPDGVTLIVTATDPKQVAIIRGLGLHRRDGERRPPPDASSHDGKGARCSHADGPCRRRGP
jgi:hypothetical protein